jgi:hypothetical protein
VRYFRARFFRARYFTFVPGDAVAEAETPDVYAWFPGDGYGAFRPGKRYEEYSEERPKQRRRKPVEVIKYLIPLPPYILDVPGYETPEPLVPVPEFGAPPEIQPQPEPRTDPRIAERWAKGRQSQQLREQGRPTLEAKAAAPRPMAQPQTPDRQQHHVKAWVSQQTQAMRYQQVQAQATSRRIGYLSPTR